MTHDVISQLEPQHTTAKIDSIRGIYYIDVWRNRTFQQLQFQTALVFLSPTFLNEMLFSLETDSRIIKEKILRNNIEKSRI